MGTYCIICTIINIANNHLALQKSFMSPYTLAGDSVTHESSGTDSIYYRYDSNSGSL